MQPRRINRNKKQTDDATETFRSLLNKQIDSMDLDAAICFMKNSDGQLYFVSSDNGTDELIGMIEIGKNSLIKNLFEDED